ncbi:MAG TPA: flagellar hook-length control protein FliK [Candidatus Avisuccinivibrio pullicola]|nr:flagellar hook-length control protein FliK [Candidatus Avisuccinivibrio pullicola]
MAESTARGVSLNAFGDLTQALKQVLESEDDPTVRERAGNLLNELRHPVESLHTVNQYLSFVTGPLSPSSPLALALHQWAFLLLCLRFEQLGREIDAFLKSRLDKGAVLLESEVKENRKARLSESTTVKLLDETLNRVQELKDNSTMIAGLNLPRYLPLPPAYEGGQDGHVEVKRDKKTRTWHLRFCLDLRELGPLEVRAEAQLPELKLSLRAPKEETIALARSLLPTLREKLQKIGVTTRTTRLNLAPVDFKREATEPYTRHEEGLHLDI